MVPPCKAVLKYLVAAEMLVLWCRAVLKYLVAAEMLVL
jgi:hypothetical protein